MPTVKDYSTTEKLKVSYQQGVAAHTAGVSYIKNPYHEADPAWDWWKRGWWDQSANVTGRKLRPSTLDPSLRRRINRKEQPE